MSINAKEIAKLMGTSEATVSMALNGKPGVSEKKRAEIIRCAKENGYDFSRLKNTYTESVHLLIYLKHGAIIGDTPFFNSLFKGAEQACKLNQLNLYIKYISSLAELLAALRHISSQLKSGVILLGTEMTPEELTAVRETNVPVVVLDNTCFHMPFNSVSIHNTQGAYFATKHLLEQFKVQPGYLRSGYAIANFNERADGFYRAVRSVGMSASQSIVHYLAPSLEGSYSDMAEILRRGEATARCYFADNDLIAAGAMKAFTEAGYKVSKDVAFVGFDNIPMCTMLSPALSSIDVPKHFLSSYAVERLISIMKDPHQPPTLTLLDTELICRASSLA